MCPSRQKGAREREVDKPASHTGLPASSLVAQWMASKITWNGAVAEATRMGRTYQVLRCGEIRFSADSPAAFSDGAMLLETAVVSVSRREELPAPIVIPRERILARELQRELKRVGCYKGPLNRHPDAVYAPGHGQTYRTRQCKASYGRTGRGSLRSDTR